MHDNRVTKYEEVTKPEFDSRLRKLDTKKKDALRAKRKRERNARKTNR